MEGLKTPLMGGKQVGGCMEVRWKLEPSGIFASESIWKLLGQNRSTGAGQDWQDVWKFKGPTSPSFTLWLLKHQRHIAESPKCILCGNSIESILHVLQKTGMAISFTEGTSQALLEVCTSMDDWPKLNLILLLVNIMGGPIFLGKPSMFVLLETSQLGSLSQYR